MKTKNTGGPSKTAQSANLKKIQSNPVNITKNSRSAERCYACDELSNIRSDFQRLFNGYKQLGAVHAELLLDQPEAWRDWLITNVYASTLHPDVTQDVNTFLAAAIGNRGLRAVRS